MGDLNDVVDATAKAGGCPEVLSSLYFSFYLLNVIFTAVVLNLSSPLP